MSNSLFDQQDPTPTSWGYGFVAAVSALLALSVWIEHSEDGIANGPATFCLVSASISATCCFMTLLKCFSEQKDDEAASPARVSIV